MTQKDSFIIYRSFYIGLKALKNKDRLQLYDAIFEYGLNTTEIDLKPLPKAMFLMIKPQLQANHRKFINGAKGGRPINPNSQRQQNKETKTEPNHNQDITIIEPNVNYNNNNNGNNNGNGNDRIKMPLKSGEDYIVEPKFYFEIKNAYSSLDVDNELKKMRVWLIANPKMQKTRVGTPRFITSWLSRVKDSSPKVEDTYASIHKQVMDLKNVRK